MKLTTSFVCMALAILSSASCIIVTAAPTVDNELGSTFVSTNSGTPSPKSPHQRRRRLYQKRGFDPSDFLAREEAVREKQDAVAAAANTVPTDSDSAPATQVIDANPVLAPPPAA
ncbi:MAG: hypothetical protein J3R72DRAFT_440449 [Linnemannia gamsii]|nr:MAG: hypothetical protein J3R72DRAFT_440449 [Linnemannia gamsii]